MFGKDFVKIDYIKRLTLDVLFIRITILHLQVLGKVYMQYG